MSCKQNKRRSSHGIVIHHSHYTQLEHHGTRTHSNSNTKPLHGTGANPVLRTLYETRNDNQKTKQIRTVYIPDEGVQSTKAYP